MNGPPTPSGESILSDLREQASSLEVYSSELATGIEESVLAQRRRRRSGEPDPIGSLALVRDPNGVLWWSEGVAARALPGRRRRGAARPAIAIDGEVVDQFHFAKLEPNRISKYLGDLDDRLTPRQGLRRLQGGSWVATTPPAGKRLLVFVHGTFSNNDNLLASIAAGSGGAGFLARLERHYDAVLAFDHPTLSVSPVLNAFDLASALAFHSGDIDVIAHSRGGLVVRWWLEAFRDAPKGRHRAVLVGSPLGGTSLASPARLRAAMSLLTNYGNALKLAGQALSIFTPFLWIPVALLRIATSITGAVAKTPVLDAAIGIVPGLAAQSRAGGNAELDRLKQNRHGKLAEYFAIRSNFEPADVGWRFWRFFRKDRLKDAAADFLFDGPNDLVVDTASMTELGPKQLAASRLHDFRRSATVHHTNYFEQKETLRFIASKLEIP
jgi:hypothetical protein